jgi:hypothetical protein
MDRIGGPGSPGPSYPEGTGQSVSAAGTCVFCGCTFRKPSDVMYHRCAAMQEAKDAGQSYSDDAPIYGSDEVEQLALVGEFDARVWARHFVQTVRRIPEIPTDEETMVAWFASAIMTGYHCGRSR